MSPFKPPARDEGWVQPAGSRLRHYIRGKWSLCGQWPYPGTIGLETSGAALCESCQVRVQALEVARARALGKKPPPAG